MESGRDSFGLLQTVCFENITSFQTLIPILIWDHIFDKMDKQKDIHQHVCTRRPVTIFRKMQTYCESQKYYIACVCLCVCLNRALAWGEEDYPLLTSMQMTSDGHRITSTVSQTLK